MKKNSIGLDGLLIGAIILLLSGCAQSEVEQKRSDFSLYFVEGLTTFEAMNRSLDDLPIETTPILTEQEISAYNWGNHEFTMVEGINLDRRLEGTVPMDGKPFVVFVGNERIYVGSFWTPLSSVSDPDIPIIMSVWFGDNESTTYRIEHSGVKKEPRNDIRIFERFKELGIINNFE